MKKIIALVLALVMVLSLSTVAFADKGSKKITPTVRFVASAAAQVLRIPAQNLGNVLELSKDAIVDSVNENLPVAYRNMTNALNTMDQAVQLSAIMTEGNLRLAAGATRTAANAVSKLLNGVDNEDVKEFAGEVQEFGQAVYALAEETAKKIDTVTDAAGYLVNELQEAKVGDILNYVNNFVNNVVLKQMNVKRTLIENDGIHAIDAGKIEAWNGVSPAVIEAMQQFRLGFNDALNMTIKDALTAGKRSDEEYRYERFRTLFTNVFNEEYDEANSPVAQVVSGTIDAVSVLLKTPDYFADIMNYEGGKPYEGEYLPYVTLLIATLLSPNKVHNK